jgi:hypothetical protein
MARATDFLSQTSGKLDEMFQTRQTDHGTILARNPKRRGILWVILFSRESTFDELRFA